MGEGFPAALVLFVAAGCLLAGYISWKTFYIWVDASAIHCGFAFHKRVIPLTDIASVDHIFGKSDDFLVIRPREAASVKIWRYLNGFEQFKALVFQAAQGVGAQVLIRDRWGKWKQYTR